MTVFALPLIASMPMLAPLVLLVVFGAVVVSCRRPSLIDRLEQLFKSRPNVWIDSWELLKVGGHAAWRSRVSDLRVDRGLTIENRTRRVIGVDGPYRISEYKFCPPQPTSPLEIAEQPDQEQPSC